LYLTSRCSLSENGTVIVGHEAVAQSDHNPARTFYDAKRFIGKDFTKEEFEKEVARYPFNVLHAFIFQIKVK